MAKKRVEQENDEPIEEQPVDYENVEPEAVDAPWDDPEPTVVDETTETVITKPGGEAVALTPPDERQYRVSFALPYGVLVALLDWHHSEADVERAYKLGLLEQNYEEHAADLTKLTELGALVLSGFDQTAVRHKMIAADRAANNAAVDADKTGFERAE
jgi:hypothetical protein